MSSPKLEDDGRGTLVKAAQLIRRFLPLFVLCAITLGLLLGSAFPHGIRALKPIMPLFLVTMLYPMMINLKVEEIAKSLRNLRLFAAAIAINFILTPLLGGLWAALFFKGVDPNLAAGFILKVTVPCSGMVAAWTGYAKGRVESALIIVALSLLLSIFLVPLWMALLARVYVRVSFWLIFQKILLIVVIPLIAGVVTRRYLTSRWGMERYLKMLPLFPAVSTCGMLLMVFSIMALEARMIVGHLSYLGLVIAGIITLYPLLFVLAVLYSKVSRLDYGDAIALGYGVTAKNHAITIALAITSFSSPLAALPAACAPLIQIPLMMTILRFSKRLRRMLAGSIAGTA